MRCSIHLVLERRRKEPRKYNQNYTEGTEWQYCSIFGFDKTWSYNADIMSALLADVHNYQGNNHLPLRGFPSDASESSKQCYTIGVIDYEGWLPGNYITKRMADKFVKDGSSKWMYVAGDKKITGPYWHSANWCTVKELEDCIENAVEIKNSSIDDFIEWNALLGAMKGYEISGIFECRAVFWFDN